MGVQRGAGPVGDGSRQRQRSRQGDETDAIDRLSATTATLSWTRKARDLLPTSGHRACQCSCAAGDDGTTVLAGPHARIHEYQRLTARSYSASTDNRTGSLTAAPWRTATSKTLLNVTGRLDQRRVRLLNSMADRRGRSPPVRRRRYCRGECERAVARNRDLAIMRTVAFVDLRIAERLLKYLPPARHPRPVLQSGRTGREPLDVRLIPARGRKIGHARRREGSRS